jgi:hypothetical protein
MVEAFGIEPNGDLDLLSPLRRPAAPNDCAPERGRFRWLSCVRGDDALGDFKGAHVSVEQALTPKKLPVDANRLWHLAGAHQRAKVTLAVADVLRRVASLEVGVARGVAVLVHCHHRFALVDDGRHIFAMMRADRSSKRVALVALLAFQRSSEGVLCDRSTGLADMIVDAL